MFTGGEYRRPSCQGIVIQRSAYEFNVPQGYDAKYLDLWWRQTVYTCVARQVPSWPSILKTSAVSALCPWGMAILFKGRFFLDWKLFLTQMILQPQSNLKREVSLYMLTSLTFPTLFSSSAHTPPQNCSDLDSAAFESSKERLTLILWKDTKSHVAFVFEWRMRKKKSFVSSRGAWAVPWGGFMPCCTAAR